MYEVTTIHNIYVYVYIKTNLAEVKATYKVVQVNYVCQNNYKIKVTHAF